MRLVERHIINRADPRFAAIDAAAFASKILYNGANYLVRQSFIHERAYLNYHEMHRRMKDHVAYKALPAKVAQWVVRLLDQNWQGYFAACAARESDPSRFLGCPKLPGYKDKQQGRNLLSYTIQALSLPALERGLIMPSMLGITVKTKCQSVQQVRIVPRLGFYVIEVIYEKQPITAAVNPALRIDQYLHTASRRIIDLLIAEGIGTLCIGKNPLWKQEANLGRRTNQLVVSVPHARFIEMLTYKAQLVGIQVIETEESYTGKASFLDGDALPIYDAQRQEAPAFSGGRVKRGLYRAADGTPINADVNGAYNIMRKVAPEAFAQGSRGCVVHPIRLAV